MPQHVWIGQRIAQQHLQSEARQREQAAHARRGRHARGAQRDDQRPVEPARAQPDGQRRERGGDDRHQREPGDGRIAQAARD